MSLAETVVIPQRWLGRWLHLDQQWAISVSSFRTDRVQVVLVKLRVPIGRRYDCEDRGRRGLEICGCLRVDDGGAENHSRNDSHERTRLFRWRISSMDLI